MFSSLPTDGGGSATGQIHARRWGHFLLSTLQTPRVEDVCGLWPTVKGLFEEHQPLKRAFLTNKTRNTVFIENLPVEFILTTYARLHSRFPKDQYLLWFRKPYGTIFLVTCEPLQDLDEFKNIVKPRLKLIVQNDEKEWFIVFVSKAHPSNDQATKSIKKVYAKLEVEFS